MFLAAVRLLPAFLLAACGRSSFTAFAQEHAGLGSLLHGAQGLSPHAQTARRLQLAAMATQCLGKCKGLGALYVDMLPYMSTPEPGASLGLGDLLGSGMQSMLGGSMGAVFGTVCAHSATLSCMRTECVPPDGGLSRGIETALSEAPCLCEACPQFMTAVADMQSLSASLGNVSQGSTEYLSILCPMIGPVECATNSTQCTAFSSAMSGHASGIIEMKSACESAGTPTQPTERSPSEVSGALVACAGAGSLLAGLLWS